MKIIFGFSFLLFLTSFVSAQQTSNTGDTPDLLILKKSWSQMVAERGAGDNVDKGLKDQAEARQDILDSYKPYPVVSSRLMNPTFPVESLKTYQYELKVKNTGSKTILKIGWEYAFTDVATNERAGTVYLVSRTNIKPGETQKINGRSTTRPLEITTKNNSGKREKIKLKEEARIRRIEYSDGSVFSI